MPLLVGVLGVLVALVGLTAAMVRAARAVFEAGSAARTLMAAVESNTSSTDNLAARLDAHVTEVTKVLGEHGDRLLNLERKWWLR